MEAFHLRQSYQDHLWNEYSEREPCVCFGLTAPLKTMWGAQENGGTELLDVKDAYGEYFGNIAAYPQEKNRMMQWARDFELIYKDDSAERRECHWWQSWFL